MKEDFLVALRQTLYVCLTIIVAIGLLCLTYNLHDVRNDHFRNRKFGTEVACVTKAKDTQKHAEEKLKDLKGVDLEESERDLFLYNPYADCGITSNDPFGR